MERARREKPAGLRLDRTWPNTIWSDVDLLVAFPDRAARIAYFDLARTWKTS